MAIKIQSTKGMTNEIKVLVYSESGIGKTKLCETAPDPLILSSEAGLLSLADVSVDFQIVESYDHIDEIYNWIVSSEEAKKYKTICLDSISEIAEVVFSETKERTSDPRSLYPEVRDNMSKLIRKFRDLKGRNVYFTAKLETYDDDGVIKSRPTMPGAGCKNDLPFFFDEVMAMRIGKSEGEDGSSIEYRYLQTQPDRRFAAKDRSGKLGAIEKPDLNYIFNKIRGKNNG